MGIVALIRWLTWSYVDPETLSPLKTIDQCYSRADFNYRKDKPVDEIERNRLSIRKIKNSDERLEQNYVPPRMGGRCRTISIDGIIFTSIKEATYILKISDATIRNRCKSTNIKWKNWIYIKNDSSRSN